MRRLTNGPLARSVGLVVGGLVVAGAVGAASKTYTLDADFDLGVLSGVNHDAPNNNQLQLSATGTTFPVMWIANAGEDTVSKFDTVANTEIARYRTWFGPPGQPGSRGIHGAYDGPAPSRTSVDIHGNAYVLNRFFENKRPVLVKILAEGFVDRNSNGVPDSSSGPSPLPMADLNGNDRIDPEEITDERIAWAVEVGTPNGLGRALCIGTDGNLWVGMFNAGAFYKVSSADGSVLAGPVSVPWTPYGCLIDRQGNLWSASLGGRLGKVANTGSAAGPYPVSFYDDAQNYGIALGNDKVYLGLSNRVFDPATSAFANIGFTVYGYGIVVDGNGDIITGESSVQKIGPTGAVRWTAPLQAGGFSAIGIQVDSNNDVWQVGFSNTGRMQKYRGSDGAPLGVFPVGTLPYTYSDAAGFAARNVTNPTGTWAVVLDSGANATAWGRIGWNDIVPDGAAVLVTARAADSTAALPLQTYQPVSKNVPFAATGRYIQVQTRLNASPSNQSPVLLDLTVASNAPTSCDIDRDGDVDSLDVAAIRAGVGQAPTGGDPRDANGDGKITINDVRYCTLRCTRASCAP